MKTLIAVATLIGFIIGYMTGVKWHGLTISAAEEKNHSDIDINLNAVSKQLTSNSLSNQPMTKLNEAKSFKAVNNYMLGMQENCSQHCVNERNEMILRSLYAGDDIDFSTLTTPEAKQFEFSSEQTEQLLLAVSREFIQGTSFSDSMAKRLLPYVDDNTQWQIIKILQQSDKPSHRAEALDALQTSKRDARLVTEYFTETLIAENNESVLSVILSGLSDYADSIQSPELSSRLSDMVSDYSITSQLRQQALTVLHQMQKGADEPTGLIEQLFDSQDVEEQLAAITLVGNISHYSRDTAIFMQHKTQLQDIADNTDLAVSLRLAALQILSQHDD